MQQEYISKCKGIKQTRVLQKKETVAFELWEKNIYLYFWGIVLNFFYCILAAPEFLKLNDFKVNDLQLLEL